MIGKLLETPVSRRSRGKYSPSRDETGVLSLPEKPRLPWMAWASHTGAGLVHADGQQLVRAEVPRDVRVGEQAQVAGAELGQAPPIESTMLSAWPSSVIPIPTDVATVWKASTCGAKLGVPVAYMTESASCPPFVIPGPHSLLAEPGRRRTPALVTFVPPDQVKPCSIVIVVVVSWSK